ncbi:hypothetical protein FOMPIDRAFT_1055182 [Fomitopsis schrenkii]|uniref:Uncharacterized protein n=1 Tax=Fomitopsis schrenkii TaxID=2126942 RepID=S8EXM6_FOMSC|nr:hypothetical protein FOMPIDRAFT_1055182 [Fomitopsis schrenkii]
MLAYCTLLSAVGPLDVIVNPMDSWRGLVTALHGILSHFSSPVIRTLQLDISMRAPNDSPSTSTHPDSEFWTLDLGSIHDLIKRPLFNSLRSANICMRGFSSDPRLTCDAVLTAEEMERRVRLILEPWDKRGILTAEGYNEPTDEAIRWEPAMDGRDSEKGGSGGGVGGEEAQSSEDKAAFASDQEDEDEDSLEGSTQDLVEDRE